MPRASGVRTVRTVRIGSFTATAVADGAEVSIGDVQTRVSNWCFRRLHAWTLKDSPQGSQPGGNASLCQNVSGCFRTCRSHRTPPPAARRNAPHGALFRGQVNGDEIARRSLNAPIQWAVSA